MSELTELLEGIKKDFHELRGANDQRISEIEKKGTALGLTKEKVEKINEAIQKQEDLQKELAAEKKSREDWQRLADSYFAQLSRPGQGGSQEDKTSPYRKAFSAFLRKGIERMGPEDIKALTEGTASQGGHLVPDVMAQIIMEKILEFSPLRSAAQVFTSSIGNDMDVPLEFSTVFATGWVAETAARPETAAGTFDKVTITAIEQYANPSSTVPMLEDTLFDIEGYIAKKVGEQLGKLEGTGFINGTNSTQPMGILHASAGYATFDVSATGAGVAITADGVIGLFYSLITGYVANSIWLLNRTSLKEIRLLKDTTNQYLWSPGLTNDTPATILGRPYLECPDMQSSGTNGNKCLAIGDWNKAYGILDRQGIRMLRDPYSNKPYVHFYTTRRVGGRPLVSEAAWIGTVTTA